MENFQPKIEKEIPMENFSLKLSQWNKDKGFGFGSYQGQKFFVHVSKIFPVPQRGTNLSGQEIFVLATEKSEKGLRVSSALTLAEWQRQKEKKEIAERDKNTAKEIFLSNPESLWKNIKYTWNPEYREIEGFPGVNLRDKNLVISASLKDEEFIIINKISIEMVLSDGKKLGEREFTQEFRGEEAWQFLNNRCYPNVTISGNMATLEWNYTYGGSRFSFSTTAPVIFEEPQLLTQNNWTKKPYRIVQRASVKIADHEVWQSTPFIWPKDSASTELGGSYDIKPLINEFNGWNVVARLQELSKDAKFSVSTEPQHVFHYHKTDYVWNNRDSDELCGHNAVERNWTEVHPSVQIKYEKCPLLVGKEGCEEGSGNGEWTHTFSIEGLTAEGIEKKVGDWVEEEIESFGFKKNEEVLKFAKDLTDKICKLIP